MKRTVIKIDEERCNGCGNCVDGCHEGALQLIGGKAVMISDLYCDGLGACIGECPVGAIAFEEREAVPYDEQVVMERLIPKGAPAIVAHLRHLHGHGEYEWVRQGLDYLDKHGIRVDSVEAGPFRTGRVPAAPGSPKPESGQRDGQSPACGCPGSTVREIGRPRAGFVMASGTNREERQLTGQPSELRQFPVQLRLLDPRAGFLRDADLLLAADCTAFACGGFHDRFLRGKSLAIACPKLDGNVREYTDKLAEMIDGARIGTLTVLVMEVPCCRGLVRMAREAREQAQRHIPVRVIVLSVGGEVLGDEWI